ncbi:hypothetical protein VNO77_26954 [Canavalia gladiata]|uniref:Uncharacterized protein n=1 Tax=Canavalia gladiata TaxID=3824 RepID=A0AAN9Q3S8_CANGL
MLQYLFFSLGFSALPLILYFPPVRNLTLFVEAIEDIASDSRIYTRRIYPHLRVAWSSFMNYLLCTTRSIN